MKAPKKQRVTRVVPVQAPTGGIDDTNSIANMDKMYALQMLNMYPEATSLRVRYGYREHVTGMASAGKTLMSYNGANGTNKLFCCTDDGIYDVTASSATPTMVKAITNGEVIWTQFSNLSGNWLIGCNGTDPAFLYDGTNWIDFVNDATPTNPGEINGSLSPSGIVYVHQHKSRLWFLEKDTMSAWYLPLNAVAGNVTAFPMGGIFKKGGYLTSIFSWTMDAGYSVDDIFVMQTSRGEVAGYGGTDPDNASTWWLEARYYIGAPLGRRSVVPLNGDHLILTEYGIIPLSRVVGGQYQLGAPESTVSYRISKTLNEIVRQRSGSPGWELASCPAAQSIILSIPEAAGYSPTQYVMNSVTGAWTTYDLPAITFHEHIGTTYFTDDSNRVLRYGETSVDNVMLDGTGQTPIVSGFQQAYNYFGEEGVSKHFKMVKPIFESTSMPSYLITVAADYEPGGLDSLGTPSTTTAQTSEWDAAVWDEDIWSPSLGAFQEWVGVANMGYSGSLILKIRSTVATKFVASHWAYESGVSL